MNNEELQEMWISAIEAGMFCPDCALPMLMIPSDDNPNVGTYQCPYCTWLEDEHGYVFAIQLEKLKSRTKCTILQLCDEVDRLRTIYSSDWLDETLDNARSYAEEL